MAQQYKIDRVQKLKEEIGDSQNFIFTDYRGLNVEQLNGLRNTLRDRGAQYHVVKNRFMKRVFKDLGYEEFDRFLVNPTALAYFNTDISDIAKVLIESADETALELKGGYGDGTIYSSDELETISKLPSREVLVAQLMGVLNAPARGLVMALGGIIPKFVRTLKAVEELKQAEGPKETEQPKAEAKDEASGKKEDKPQKDVKAEGAEVKAEAPKKETQPKAESEASEKKEK
jgi:large subunit ribosomal protein L10